MEETKENSGWMADTGPLAVEAREFGRVDGRNRVLEQSLFKAWREHVANYGEGDPQDILDNLNRWYREGYEEVAPGHLAHRQMMDRKMGLSREAYNFGFFMVPVLEVEDFQDWKARVIEEFQDDQNLGALIEVIDREYAKGMSDRTYRAGYNPL